MASSTSILHVKVATTGFLNLSAEVPDATIDNVILTEGDRVLVKAQGIGAHADNGIYTLGSNGILVRAENPNGMPLSSLQTPGQLIIVAQGDTFGDTGWMLSSDSDTEIMVGAVGLEFIRFTAQSNIINVDLPSSIILRAEKGSPLTITELDNNFKFLVSSLVKKFDADEFTSANICAEINSVEPEVSNINANRLNSILSNVSSVPNTIPERDDNEKITAVAFIGDLEGNATTATYAISAESATNITGIVTIANGGTNATSAQGARLNLNALSNAGVDNNGAMTGKLKLMPSTAENASLNFGSGVDSPQLSNRVNGDIWSTSTQLKYRLNNSISTIAILDSPEFIGNPTAPNPVYAANSQTLATTKFVQDHHTVIDAALALKSTIASPTFTGTPQSVVPSINDNSAMIATTSHVRDFTLATVPTLSAITGKVEKSGDVMTGALVLSEHPTINSPILQAATKQYVDTKALFVSSGSLLLTTAVPNGDVTPPFGYTMSTLKGFIPAFGSTIQAPATINVILMIDNSQSANSGSTTYNGTTYASSLLAEREAAKYLVNAYKSLGTTAVCIYYCDNTNTGSYKWFNSDEAIVQLTSGATVGYTSGTVASAFNVKTQVAGNNVCYFLSDAEHYQYPGTSMGSSETTWKAFLNGAKITAYALAIGSTGNASNISQIAWDGKTGSELSGVQSTLLSDLQTVLTTSTASLFNAGSISYSVQSTKIVVSLNGNYGQGTGVSVNWLALWQL
jgi:hypothetical protein